MYFIEGQYVLFAVPSGMTPPLPARVAPLHLFRIRAGNAAFHYDTNFNDLNHTMTDSLKQQQRNAEKD